MTKTTLILKQREYILMQSCQLWPNEFCWDIWKTWCNPAFFLYV